MASSDIPPWDKPVTKKPQANLPTVWQAPEPPEAEDDDLMPLRRPPPPPKFRRGTNEEGQGRVVEARVGQEGEEPDDDCGQEEEEVIIGVRPVVDSSHGSSHEVKLTKFRL